MTMDLDEMKQRWQELDRKLDASLRLDQQVLRELKQGGARASLARLSRWVALDVVVNAVVLVVLVGYVASRAASGHIRFVVPALTLCAFTMWILATGVWLLTQLERIDLGAPVLTIQKHLEQLRVHRIRKTKWIFLLAPLVWTPLLIVALDGFLGLDAYGLLGAAYLAANLAFGLVVIPLVLWLSRRYADRMAHSPLLRRIMDDIGGRNLARAREQLEALAALQRE